MSVQPSRPDEAELLTPGAVAAALFVDPKTVTRWARAGKIDSIRTPGGHRRYRRSDVEALRAGDSLRDGESAGTAPPPVTSNPLEDVSAPAARPERLAQVATHGPPWAAAELAEAVASALEVEAEASIARLWRAQAELDAAQRDVHAATARAHQARARADAERRRAATRHPAHLPFPTQSGPLASYEDHA